jgi:phage terminase small subunit
VASRDEHGLTAKQRAFADLYRAAEDPSLRGNAAACYRQVYGVGMKSSEAHGPRLVGNGRVRAYLAKHAAKTAAEVEVTSERVLKEIARIAFLDPRRIYAPDGSLLETHEWQDDIAAAVSGIETMERQVGDGTEVVTKKVRFWNKNTALEQLTKILQTIKDAGPTQNVTLNMIYQQIVAAASQQGRIPAARPRSGVVSGGS